ncbi:hypothetical protein ACX0G9_27935 [Flavitalea flava]
MNIQKSTNRKGEFRGVVGRSEDWKSSTSSYLDIGFLLDFVTPEEFFYQVGIIYGISRAEIDKKLLVFHSFFNEENLGKKKKYIRDFSKGNKQKIVILEKAGLVCDLPNVVGSLAEFQLYFSIVDTE